MMTIKIGATVKQKVPTIKGAVTERRFDEATEGMEYHVEWTDAQGDGMGRWFKEAELEVTKDAPAKDEDTKGAA